MTDKTIRVSNAILLAVRYGVLSDKYVIGLLAVKLNYVDSIIRNASVRNVASLLHCGKDMATEILKEFAKVGLVPDENKNINVWHEIKFYREKIYTKFSNDIVTYSYKRIGGYQKLYIRNNKVYIKFGNKESKGYDITYRNLKKILLMLTELNFIKQAKRYRDQEAKLQRSTARCPKMADKRFKTMMFGKAKGTNGHAYKNGVSYEVIAKQIGSSISTVKKITKELALIGAIAISNPTNLHEPVFVMDYDIEHTIAQRKDKTNYKNMSTLDMFKALAAKGDPILKTHSEILNTLHKQGYATVRSFTTTSLGEDDKYHTRRLYYAMMPNEYKCLV